MLKMVYVYNNVQKEDLLLIYNRHYILVLVIVENQVHLNMEIHYLNHNNVLKIVLQLNINMFKIIFVYKNVLVILLHKVIYVISIVIKMIINIIYTIIILVQLIVHYHLLDQRVDKDMFVMINVNIVQYIFHKVM